MSNTPSRSPLAELSTFGSNPGALKGWIYLPGIMAPRAALVVALHGCTQDAAGYDHGSGWSKLAEKNGFAVLYPEQQRSNNANGCFNWFEPGDTRRGAGETESIRQMIDHVTRTQGIDPNKVYVTGLSAGGAMANAMLATHPELFAGGAIIGGLPYGVSHGVPQAFERMQGRNQPSVQTLQSAVRAASSHAGPWPKISVWHGTHDHTVKPVNAAHSVDQWRGVHGLTEAPHRRDAVNGHQRDVWLDKNHNVVLEIYTVKGMSHGVPLATRANAPVGNAGPFMLDANISSTARIAVVWGLADERELADMESGQAAAAEAGILQDGIASFAARFLRQKPDAGTRPDNADSAATNSKVNKVITDALRSAGLLR